MTELGLYLSKRSVNRSDVSRKTGISKTRLFDLTNRQNAKLLASELYLISLAIGLDPCDAFKDIYKDLALRE